MTKDSLRKKNYTPVFVQMPLAMLNVFSVLFVALFTLTEIILTICIQRVMIEFEIKPVAIPLPIFITVPVISVAMLYLYFALVSGVSKNFCESKRNNAKLRFLEQIKMPSCTCIEGLKPNQLIITYIVSIFVILLFFAVFGSFTDNVMISIIAFFCAIFFAPDASLVLYILHLKKRHKPEYIIVQDHLSDIILYKR